MKAGACERGGHEGGGPQEGERPTAQAATMGIASQP